MKVKYMLNKQGTEFQKKQLLEKVVKVLGTKVAITGGEICIDKNDESRVVDLLTKSGLKYQKIA